MGKKDVPVAGHIDNFENYEIVFIGFPKWNPSLFSLDKQGLVFLSRKRSFCIVINVLSPRNVQKDSRSLYEYWTQ